VQTPTPKCRGKSPLDAIRECFSKHIPVTDANILGVLSLIFFVSILAANSAKIAQGGWAPLLPADLERHYGIPPNRVIEIESQVDL
jgi:K+ transporter